MQNEWEVSFENMGMSSYLAITFGAEARVISYQVEMITANEISHLLKASKRVINGRTAIYYNISSKIQLSRILERRKLRRDELLALIRGVLDAVKDGKEYQLTGNGFLMDAEYIYVDPDTCSPYFIYLPVNRPAGEDVQDFLRNLIVQGKIEMSSDNLIQVLLEALNQQPFSAETLKSCVGQFQSRREVKAVRPPEPARPPEPVRPVEMMQPPEGVMGGTPVTWNSSDLYREQQEEPAVTERRLDLETAEEPVKPRKKGKPKAEKKKKIKREKGAPSQEEFDRESAKKKFLLPQAAVMVILAALVSFGAFTDENGAIALKNILAVVLIVAVGEVILYREVYVNGKEKKTEKSKGKEKTAREKERGSGRPSVPDRSRRQQEVSEQVQPPVRRPEPVQQPARPEVSPDFRPEPPVHQPHYTYGSDKFQNGMGKRGYTPVQEPFSAAPEPDFSSETELWEGDAEDGAYLEYYVNGVMSRVKLNRPSTLIGRLSSQVDFAVSNPKVGKIHAEFLNQGGAIYVKDLNSKNGTYINRSGQRINSNIPYPLKDNDRISLADSEFTLRCR